jgi:uncharacterized protein (TIGR02466 family)
MKNIPFDINKSVLPAFMTPIGKFKVPNAEEINPAIEQEIIRRMKKDTGQVRSNVGGWHSQDDLFKWALPEIKELKEWAHSAVMRMISLAAKSQKFDTKLGIAGWANVNGPGQFNAHHNHPDSHWSGVYYVNVGDYESDPLPKAGNLQFYDPRGSINMMQHPGKSIFGRTLHIQPKDGALILFPAWLFHSVNPFMSETQRISIAFNVKINAFTEKPAKEKKKTKSTGKKIQTKKTARKK